MLKIILFFITAFILENFAFGQSQNDTSYVEKEVSFLNTNTILSASLILPKISKPCPVIIFIHGDGPTNRDFYGYYRALWKQFTNIGFACFAWDKPGVGKSTSPYGKYNRDYPISFYQRAAEVRQAIDYLKTQKEIDTTQIGTWSISQGGWISTMVASQTKDISFMIDVSPAGQPAVVQSEYQIALKMKDDGKSASEIKNEIIKYRQENDSAPKPIMNKDFFTFLSGKAYKWTHPFARSADYDGSFFIDPKAFLNKIRCPVLAIYGDKDRNVNYKVSSKVYQTNLLNSMSINIKFFHNADHILFHSTTGKDSEWRKKLVYEKDYDYVNGYLEFMTNWLKKIKRKSKLPTTKVFVQAGFTKRT